MITRRAPSAVWAAPVVGAVAVALVLAGARCHRTGRFSRMHADAALSQAELSGRNSVAMAVDSVLDLLTRTAPLIAAYEADPRPSPVAEWKAALARDCAREAAHLGTVLARWRVAYNSQHAELARDVEPRLAPGAGTLLLSQAQAGHLVATLNALRPRGPVEIRLASAAPAGQEQLLLVGGVPVRVPADPPPPTARPVRWHEAELAAAYRRGQLAVVDRAAAALDDLRRRRTAARLDLPPDVAAEVDRRLARAESELAALVASVREPPR